MYSVMIYLTLTQIPCSRNICDTAVPIHLSLTGPTLKYNNNKPDRHHHFKYLYSTVRSAGRCTLQPRDSSEEWLNLSKSCQAHTIDSWNQEYSCWNVTHRQCSTLMCRYTSVQQLQSLYCKRGAC